MDLAIEFKEPRINELIAAIGDTGDLMMWAAYFQLRNPDAQREIEMTAMFESYLAAKGDSDGANTNCQVQYPSNGER